MKKVLFISFYWPPSGKASMHWPLKMAETLPQYGWQPKVLTARDDSFTEKDYSLIQDLDEIEVIRTELFDPFIYYKKFIGKKKSDALSPSDAVSKHDDDIKNRFAQWIRMNLFIPDARIGWYKSAVKGASEYLNNEKVDVIVSNGPPHTSHLIGKKLSKKFNIPLVTVFIDPWVDISYYKGHNRNPLVLKVDEYLEKSVLNHAVRSIFVTQGLVDYFEKKYPFIKNKSVLMHWGYNESDFENLISGKSKTTPIMLHAGNLYDHQNPIEFWKYVKSEIDNGRKLKLRFVGSLGPGIKNSLKNYGLTEHVEYAGFLSYKEVLSEMMNADYLLVCASEPRHIPGKLFEYLRTGKPIAAFADDNSEVKQLIEESGAGFCFTYKEGGKGFFDKAENLNPDIEFAKRFDRKKIAAELGKLLDSIQ